MTLRLNQEETHELIENGSVVVVRNGFEICVNKDFYNEKLYDVQVVNPYDVVKVSI